MPLMHLIGPITSYIIFLSIFTGEHCVFSAHVSSDSSNLEFVVIEEDAYVSGMHDYAGDPCSGAAAFEGDISLPFIINPDTNMSYILLPSNHSSEGRSRRGATANPNYLWPNAIIYYTMDSSITDDVRSLIYLSMHHWEELTCIRFRAWTTERDYLEFFKGVGCCSYIGSLKRGRQKISIGPRCDYFPSITHEIGHTVGFWHEMNRPDRDDHIRIVTENIPSGFGYNFEKLSHNYINSRGFVYDYNSIMHYSATAFSINGKDTIEPIQTGIPIGPEFGLTELDANQTKAMYNCHLYGNRASTVPSSSTPLPEESFSPNCGSLLTGFRGTFSFSARSESSSLCQWLIKVPSGYNIKLVVDMVLPGRTGSCTNGLEVIDGHQIRGNPHGEYCGNFRDYTFLATYNYMLVKMHVDNRALGAEFSAVFTARDVDECSYYNTICTVGCQNTPGGFTCICNEGFYVSRNKLRCFDINECAYDYGGCSNSCVNTAGSYMCSCPSGYSLGGDKKTCFRGTPQEQCRDNNGGCEHNCVVSGDIFYCSCNLGYKIYTDNKRCADVNECSSNPCPVSFQCSNTIGSYTCECPTGFVLSGDECIDVNECEQSLCDHTCTNTAGSYACSCKDNFELYSDSVSCFNRDCSIGNEGCPCEARNGACNCNTGYTIGNGRIFCQDVDECAVSNGECPLRCINTIGSYTCTCSLGQVHSQVSNSCVDEDECSSGTHLCEQGCVNTEGSYYCVCPTGYQISENYRCTDLNECTSLSCGSNQLCVNTPGSYTCQCQAGYTTNQIDGTCDDVNECNQGNHLCAQACVNTVGTYICGCFSGYQLTSATSCNDIDECTGGSHQCGDNQYCLNNVGSYTCKCLFGYRMNLDTRECVDIDECTEETNFCAQNCINEVGSYRCGCNEGYSLSGTYACADVDECASPNTNTCSEREVCLNLLGNYYCYCAIGFTRVGDTCQDVDECLNARCDHSCHNNIGSFTCSCDSGFSLYRDYRSCYKAICVIGTAGCRCAHTGSVCNCLEGYKRGKAGIFCQDFNECNVNNGSCSHSCSNTLGSYQCSCPSGLELSWNAKNCIEITTCSENNGGCEQVCQEATPGVRCLCREGFVLSEDRRACKVRPVCYANGGCQHICTEVDGRAQCSCYDNNQLAADQTSCVRNSYCSRDSTTCEHTCDTSRNICVCKEGFALGVNGQTCADINECAFPHLSGCSYSCLNTEGSYLCNCPQGFWIGSDGRTCRENSAGCGGSVFSNSPGSLPTLSGPYPMQCVWNITVPRTQLALFRIYYLSFGLANSCDGFSIETWDPRSPNYTQLGSQCRGAFNKYFTGVGSTLLVKVSIERDYRPYHSFYYYGISSNVFGSSNCRQSIVLGSNFSSPNFPLPYSPNSECTVYISGEPSYIYLRFYFLNLEWSEDCERDYIIVRDVQYNYNVYNQPLARLCGNTLPGPIESRTGQFSLVFHSDSSVERGGFYATTY